MSGDGMQTEGRNVQSSAQITTELKEQINRIEVMVEQLLQQKTEKEWYTTDEAAEILGKAPFTVREWCRKHRIKASKRDCGRGNSREWVISQEELTRIRNEGLLTAGEY